MNHSNPTRQNIQLITGLVLLLATCFSSAAQNLEAELKWWEPDGPVYAIHKADGVVYLGGDFDNVAVNRPYGVPISLSSGNPNMGFPVTNGTVYAAEPDGNGGWYIGGSFTVIDGQTRRRLAHIDSNGELTSWNPNVSSGMVYDIAVSGNTVYVGGQFANIGGIARSHIASLNASTGAVNAWNPGANQAVRAIAVSGNTVYAGGDFAQLGGQLRLKAGAVSATTGLATSWDPYVVGNVYDIIIDGNTAYVCGSFAYASSVTRNNIAAISTAGLGNETSWNPNVNGPVYDMELVNDTLYFVGDFTTVGFTGRNSVAAVTTNGTVTSFNPNANGAVRCIQTSGNTAFFGGDFTTVGGQPRTRLAAADRVSGTLEDWDPRANNTVHELSADGARVYAGGEFTNLGLTERQGIVALDEATGIPTDWAPQVLGTVYAIETKDDVVYIGGAFSNVSFQTRNNLAAIGTNAFPINWMPSGTNDDVKALKFSADTLYVGGLFTVVANQSRNYLAAIDPTSNILPNGWAPNPNGAVNCLELAGNRVFAGGQFTSMDGAGRTYLAAFELGTGTLDAFSKNITGMVPSVSALSASQSKLFIAGLFSSIDFNTRNNAAAIDLSTDGLDSWNPNASSLVRAVAAGDRSVFVGGAFDAVGGQSRDWLAELDSTTAAAQSWNPSPYNQVTTFLADENIIYIGGLFVRDLSSPFKHDYFAVYSRCVDNSSAYSVTAINSYTVPSGDETYTASGTYMDTIPNQCGLDSVMTITVDVLIYNEWTGATNSTWSNTGNWSFGTVPNGSENAFIPSSAVNQPIIDNNPASPATCADLLIENGAVLTVNSGKALTITGNTDNNGAILVKADATGIGSLITEGTITGSGSFQMEQYLTGSGGFVPDGLFWYVSTPVIGANAETYDLLNGNRLWSADETSQSYPQIFDGTTTLQPTTGYVARMGATGVVTLEGTNFNNGAQTASGLTRTGTTQSNRGYNLVGNPYPSTVSWNSANRTNLEPTIWYRTHNGSTMLYDTYNATSGIGTNNNGNGDVTGDIPPTQSFWVRVDVDGNMGSLGFDLNDRSHGTQASIYKTSVQEGLVRLALGNGTVSDEAIVMFDAAAQDDFDDYDSRKYWAGASVPQLYTAIPQLYTTENNDTLVINGLTSTENNPTIPLGIKIPSQGNYTLNANDITVVGETVHLEDAYLNIFQDLNVEPNYAFTSGAGNIGDRFVLHFGMTAVGIEEGTQAGSRVYTTNANQLNIILSENTDNGNVDVLDMAGRVVFTSKLNSNRTTLGLNVNAGVYLIRVGTEKGTDTHRVLFN